MQKENIKRMFINYKPSHNLITNKNNIQLNAELDLFNNTIFYTIRLGDAILKKYNNVNDAIDDFYNIN